MGNICVGKEVVTVHSLLTSPGDLPNSQNIFFCDSLLLSHSPHEHSKIAL